MSKELIAEGFVELIDLVEYKDLLVNKEYKLDLLIMNKSTSKPLMDKDGNLIKSRIKFIPKKQSGSVQVPIKLDISNLGNKNLKFIIKKGYTKNI